MNEGYHKAVIEGLGTKLATLRVSKNIKQKDLATFLGVSTTTMNGYEKRDKVPPLDVLLKLARRYGVTVDSLLDIDEPIVITTNGLKDHQIELLLKAVEVFEQDNNT